jgi:LysW-gamma-L-lysine carboxypeptidase
MAFRSAVSQKTGSSAKLVFKSGSGDMNILGNSWNIPTVTYGPGDTKLSHTNGERIRLEDVEKSAEIVSDALILLERESQ